MKKLLAIAVVAAMTAPAMADTSVYGSVRGLIQKSGDYSGIPAGSTAGLLIPGSDDLAASDNGTRLGFKGSNSIDNGLEITHQFELRSPITGGGPVTSGYMNVGVKGGFGHVQLGKMDTVMDDVDGGAGYLTNGSFAAQGSDGASAGQLKYTGAFGPVTVLASTILKGNQGAAGTTKSQIGLTYKAGPFKAGIATASNVTPTPAGPTLVFGKGITTSLKTKVALSYTGANYAVGLVHAITDSSTKYKSNTLGGKYSFGKAYVAAAIGRGKVGSGKLKQNDFELGYALSKGTKVYFQSKSLKTNAATNSTVKKSTGVGFQHNF